MGERRRIGHVDDHRTIGIGLNAILANQPDLELVAFAATVPELLKVTTDLDLVLLDLRLSDGSSPAANVEALAHHKIETLVYTSGEDSYLVRAAAKAGVLGVLLKTESPEQTVAAIRDAAWGRTVASVDWAAAIDSDPAIEHVGLSERQRDVLELYASGAKAGTVARRMGLSEETVVDYITRIRKKYAEAGRPAGTKTDLYIRAVEDGIIPGPRPARRDRDTDV